MAWNNQWQQPQAGPPGSYVAPQYPPAQAYGPALAFAPPQAYPSPPGSPRRGGWIIALIVAIAVAVVLAVAIVVVIAFDRAVDRTPVTAPPSASPGPVDSCLVGTWRQVHAQVKVPFGESELGRREKLGTMILVGGGRRWTIEADGSATEDNSRTSFHGKTEDGRTVDAVMSGSTEWRWRTEDNTIFSLGIRSTSKVTIKVNGVAVGEIELESNQPPIPYTCADRVWQTSTTTDTASFARYEKVS